mgnify:CR=1 FL=1
MSACDNPRAFPTQIDGVNKHGSPGMTLRDYFAGQALVGILGGGFADTIPHSEACGEVAQFAYHYADAMLAERAKGGAA